MDEKTFETSLPDLASLVDVYHQQELEYGKINLKLMRDETGVKAYEVAHWELGRIGRIELRPKSSSSCVRLIPENYISREEVFRLEPVAHLYNEEGKEAYIEEAKERIRVRKLQEFETFVDQLFKYLGEQAAESEPKPRINRERRKPGRPHKPDDVWAWEQVNIYGCSPADVQEIWQTKIKDAGRQLEDPNRQFKRIILLDWMAKKE